MIEKRILVADRVRRPPSEGFSWVDRRFLREYAAKLTGEGILLYFFLSAVSDKDGLSFYRDSSIAVRLRMRERAVVAAREELLIHDLIAFQPPLTKVLSLPRVGVARGGLRALGEVVRTLKHRPESMP